MQGSKFRKKPVVIEAVHFRLFSQAVEIARWCGGYVSGITETEIRIPTPKGEMTAKCGDWIIKGVKGEFYPCKSDIFEQTYEWVEF